MTIGSSSGIFARLAWKDASPGGPSVIADVISAVAIGAGPVGRGSRSQSLGYVGGCCGQGETVTPREIVMRPRGTVGAAEEEKAKRVVDLDGSLDQSCISNVGEDVG
jgi:hypothetical protein